MQSTDVKRGQFTSKIGIILASAGSAVGLGNIWRFPYETGENGGAAFILIYIACVILIGAPIMISEFVIGRRGKANTSGAFRSIAPGTPWYMVGMLGVLTGIIILGYYTVVAGWTLEYVIQAAIGGFAGKSPVEFQASFVEFSTHSWRPLIWLAIFMFLTHYIVVSGVEKGIERYSKIMMPGLLVIMLVLVGCSVSLPGASKGLEFLLSPDFSKVDGKVLMSAMGQAFFSLSIGMGCLCTYSSYFKRDVNLARTAFSVVSLDTLVAILAGLIIFPAAFSVNIQPDMGPSLIFVTLPNVFQQAFGSMPVLSWVFSVMFYLLLSVAALTSTISLHEVVTAYIKEEFKISRKKAAWIVTIFCLGLGVIASLSLGAWTGASLFGMSFFDFSDYITTKIMMPIGGMLISIFVGWYMDRKDLRDEMMSSGELKNSFFKVFAFILKYIVPLGIAILFINGMGWI